MKSTCNYFYILFIFMLFLSSCSIMEKSSMHGFNSGYYNYKSDDEKSKKVYVDITDEQINVYPVTETQPDKNRIMTFPFIPSDSFMIRPVRFSRKSLDIDITTILFKFHPPFSGLPPQMTVDFNAAIYAGWRHDNYHIKGKMDPLGKSHHEIVNRGYDFGVFAGPGTTLISPFTTKNKRADEYNGMVLQFGLAGFIESNVASFGVAAGFDYLFSDDWDIWIYNKKPWLGFIVGIALN
jgi:hypothetical protein